MQESTCAQQHTGRYYDMTTILIQQASPSIQYASLFKPWGSALAARQGGGRCNLCQHKYSGAQWHLRCSRGKAAQSSECNIDAPPSLPPFILPPPSPSPLPSTQFSRSPSPSTSSPPSSSPSHANPESHGGRAWQGREVVHGEPPGGADVAGGLGHLLGVRGPCRHLRRRRLLIIHFFPYLFLSLMLRALFACAPRFWGKSPKRLLPDLLWSLLTFPVTAHGTPSIKTIVRILRACNAWGANRHGTRCQRQRTPPLRCYILHALIAIHQPPESRTSNARIYREDRCDSPRPPMARGTSHTPQEQGPHPQQAESAFWVRGFVAL